MKAKRVVMSVASVVGLVLMTVIAVPPQASAWCRAMGGYSSFAAQAEAQRRAAAAQPVVVVSEQVKKDQQVMKDLGYYTGDIDGRSVPAFQASITEFRMANGLGVGTTIDVKARVVLDGGKAVTKEQSVKVKADQTALKSLGYYEGDVNGSSGVAYETAVVGFRKANGLGAAPTLDVASRNVLGGGKAITMAQHKQAVAEQTTLKSLGYYKGDVDGLPGAAYQAAVIDFHRVNGLGTGTTIDERSRRVFRSVTVITKQEGQDQDALRTLGYYQCVSNTPSASPVCQMAVREFRKANGLGKGNSLDASSRAVLTGGKAVTKQAWEARARWWQVWRWGENTTPAVAPIVPAPAS